VLVVPPCAYDVQLVAQEGGQTYGSVFRGLTRTDPVLQLTTIPARVPKKAKLSAEVFWLGGSGSGVLFGNFTGAALAGPNLKDVFWETPADLEIEWYGTSPLQATVQALTWHNSTDSLPWAYTGYDAVTTKLDHASTVTWHAAPTMFGLSDGSLQAAIAPPNTTGYRVDAKAVFVQPKQGPVAPRIINDATNVWSSTYLVPVHADLTYTFCGSIRPAQAANPHTNYSVVCNTGLVSGNSVSVAPEAPPQLLAPSNDQQGVNQLTDFSWAPLKSAVYLMLVYAEPLWISVVTTDTKTTLPDLKALGATLPGGTSFTYSVYAVAPFAGTDEAAGPTGFLGAWTAYTQGRAPSSNATIAVSEAQTFKTQ
jgi:hypothetical protein